jgi:two-component system OmpR family sensor kinase
VRSRTAEARLLHRTSLRLGAQAALLVAVTLVALMALASLVVLRAQHAAADTLLRGAVERADDVTDPPAGVWLVLRRGGTTVSSPGLPPGLPDGVALEAVAAGGGRRESDEHRGSREFRVLTVVGSEGVVQAALDLGADHAERGRLLEALLAGGALGLLLAVVSGTVLGRRAVRPLGDALALQRRFVADASHELRTPLTLLSTRAQLLERGLTRPGGDRAALLADAGGVVADAHRLAEVVEDLLVAADPRTRVEPVDLGGLLAEVAASATAYADSHGVHLSAGTPAAPVVVDGQPAGLRRALVALVDNAIEHTPRGGDVELACVADGPRQVRLAVQDGGPGLDPALRGDLLARFRSGGHGAGRRHYGLGLSLADEVAARHGGRLDVGAGPDGRGSVFALVLPMPPPAPAIGGGRRSRRGR